MYFLQEYVTSQSHRSTLGGLQAGEKYLIQVNTVTSKGESPYSGSMVVTTNEMTQTVTQKMKNDLGINTLESDVTDLKSKDGSLATDINNLAAKDRSITRQMVITNLKITH